MSPPRPASGKHQPAGLAGAASDGHQCRQTMPHAKLGLILVVWPVPGSEEDRICAPVSRMCVL